MTPPLKACLLLIDIQNGINEGLPPSWKRSTPSFEVNVANLLAAFRKAKHEIIHVRQSSNHLASEFHPSKSGFEPMPFAVELTSEAIVVKYTSSAFVRTELEELINARGIERLVVVGMSSAHCVSSTVRSASDLRVVKHSYGGPGNEVLHERIVVVTDATALWWDGDAEAAHKTTMDTLDMEFCDVRTTEEVLATLRS